ncbi:MAG: hypothetical protein ACTTI5_08055, partial [Treponema sp.]
FEISRPVTTDHHQIPARIRQLVWYSRALSVHRRIETRKTVVMFHVNDIKPVLGLYIPECSFFLIEQTLRLHRICIHIPPISKNPKPAKPFRHLQVPILYTFW